MSEVEGVSKGEWRNRQTRMVEGHVPERGWGFKSPFAHRRPGNARSLLVRPHRELVLYGLAIWCRDFTSRVPEGEFVPKAGQEGAFAGGLAGRWETVGRPVQQVRAPAGQGGELRVGVGFDPASIAGVGRQVSRGH